MAAFTIAPLTDPTGAEVTGLDFTRPIDADTRGIMHQANADYDMKERRYLYRLMLQGEVPA